MKIGIMQGRLLPPVDDKIQEFPKDWQQEFRKISEIGLNHIEFIVTKNSFSDFKNLPLLSQYSDRISAICCDNLVDENFKKFDFLRDQLVPICEKSISSNILNLNIPLLEQSTLNDSNFDEFSRNILEISSKYPVLNFNFEIESPFEISLNLLNLSDKFFFVYDTGNLNYIGVNHEEYLKKVINKTYQIHLKDRDIRGSHFPWVGTTDFRLIFKSLKKYNYDGLFTIQTKRGVDNNEIETIKSHSNYFKTLWQVTV